MHWKEIFAGPLVENQERNRPMGRHRVDRRLKLKYNFTVY
jgi:hypothetical protein